MPKKRSPGDGALYKIRGGKLWRGVVQLGYDADGKRIQKTVTARTQSACRDKLDDLKDQINQYGVPLDKQTTLADWSQTWLTTVAMPNVDPKTFATYKSLTNRWIVPTLGRKKVATLKPSDVRALRAAIMDSGKSTSLARQSHVVLSEMLDAARVERLCRTNVAKDVDRPGGRRDKKTVESKRRAFTTEQALAILEAAARMPNASGARWWFKMLGGPRQGEILGARLEDLTLGEESGTYAVNWKLEALVRDHGCDPENPCKYKRGANCPQAVWRVPDDFDKEQLTGAWHFTRPKSRTGRVVPIIPELAEAMRRDLEARKDQPNPYGLIWHHEDGSPIMPDEDSQEWRDLLVSAGVITQEENRPGGTQLTGHCARHTTVTILASLGVDFQLIGEIIGHSAQEVTAMYRHAQESEKLAAMEKLGGVWGDALKSIGR